MSDILETSISEPTILIFIFLVLPGFISMRVYGLFEPTEKQNLKDNLLEAASFGAMNFAFFLVPAIYIYSQDNPPIWQIYTFIITVLFLAPMLWPICLRWAISTMADRSWILKKNKNKTAWDKFFIGRQECWVILNLKNGNKVGGYFGAESFASLYPHSGHIYLEEMWQLDENGNFIEQIPDSLGAVFRPEDYDIVEMLGVTSQEAVQ